MVRLPAIYTAVKSPRSLAPSVLYRCWNLHRGPLVYVTAVTKTTTRKLMIARWFTTKKNILKYSMYVSRWLPLVREFWSIFQSPWELKKLFSVTALVFYKGVRSCQTCHRGACPWFKKKKCFSCCSKFPRRKNISVSVFVGYFSQNTRLCLLFFFLPIIGSILRSIYLCASIFPFTMENRLFKLRSEFKRDPNWTANVLHF